MDLAHCFSSLHYKRVREFMKKAGQPTPDILVEELSLDQRLTRARLLFEECMETISGLGVSVYCQEVRVNEPSEEDFEFLVETPFNLAEVIDGCFDILVVTTGTLVALGMPDLCGQNMVDENNLAKFGPGGYRNENGKWIKPPGHKPPDIEGLIAETRRQQQQYFWRG